MRVSTRSIVGHHPFHQAIQSSLMKPMAGKGSRYRVLLLCGLAGCADAPARPMVRVHASLAADTLQLSHAPNDIAAGAMADTLEASLTIGGPTSPIGFVADIAIAPDRRFWILDGMNQRIHAFTPAGESAGGFGREGSGPGELRFPWALQVFGEHLLVWERDAERSFSVFSTDGRFLTSARQPFASDWRALQLRRPQNRFEPPFRNPLEDITRRLVAIDTGVVGVWTRPDETRSPEARHSHLLALTSALDVIDTLASVRAPALRRMPDLPGIQPRYEEPHFGGFPLAASGDGWFAVHDPDSSAIDIRRSDGTRLTVRWSPTVRPVTIDDRHAYWDWHITELVNKLGSESLREEVGSMSESEFRSQREAAAREMYTARNAPRLRGMWGGGQCLWLAGFEVEDFHDGTALTLVVVGTESKKVEAVVRLPRRGLRIREAGSHDTFASYVAEDGTMRVERYSLPDDRCTSGRRNVDQFTR